MSRGRIFHTQQVHYVGADLQYTNFPVTGTRVKIGTMPAGSIIRGSIANLMTAFSPSSLSVALFEVGTLALTAAYAAGADVDEFSAGYYTITTGRGRISVDTDVYVTLSANQMAAMPVAGRIQFFLEYFPPNDNKQFNTNFDLGT